MEIVSHKFESKSKGADIIEHKPFLLLFVKEKREGILCTYGM